MIYRTLIIGIVAFVAGIAWVSVPNVEIEPELPLDDVPRSGVFYCPGSASALSAFQALSAGGGEAQVSLVDGNEVVDEMRLGGDVAMTFDTSGRLFNGGAVVEVSGPEVGAAWVGQEPTRVTASNCVDRSRATWILVGGPIAGEDLVSLRLFNPLLSSAKVDVLISTEFGPEPVTELEAVGVAPRDVVEVPLHQILGQRAFVKVELVVTEGNVYPAVVSTNPNGVATWGHAIPSSDWYLPTVRVGGTVGDIIISNPRDEIVEVEVTGIDSSGVAGQLVEAVPANGFLILPGGTVGNVVLAARVAASSGVIVGLLGDSENGRFGEMGLSEPASRWMVPGIGTDDSIDVWLYNPSPNSASVSAAGRTVQVSPGTSAHLTVTADAGLVVESDQPVVVSWSTQGRLSLSNAWPLP